MTNDNPTPDAPRLLDRLMREIIRLTMASAEGRPLTATPDTRKLLEECADALEAHEAVRAEIAQGLGTLARVLSEPIRYHRTKVVAMVSPVTSEKVQ